MKDKMRYSKTTNDLKNALTGYNQPEDETEDEMYDD